jgi:hypothetical protein
MSATLTSRSPLVDRRRFEIDYHPLKWKTALTWEKDGIITFIRIGRKCFSAAAGYRGPDPARTAVRRRLAKGAEGYLSLERVMSRSREGMRHARSKLARGSQESDSS